MTTKQQRKKRNLKKGRAYSQKYRDTHPDEIQKYSKRYRKEHSDRIAERDKRYRKANPNKIKAEKRRYYQQHKNDSKFRINQSMRSLMWYSLKSKKAGIKWEILVGYTVKDLIEHLEKQFDDKMTWNNYGSYWWIDHKKPRSLFYYNTTEEKEFKECWALDNLQPMEKIANIKKFNHYNLST